jgi:hypothetical protein
MFEATASSRFSSSIAVSIVSGLFSSICWAFDVLSDESRGLGATHEKSFALLGTIRLLSTLKVFATIWAKS